MQLRARAGGLPPYPCWAAGLLGCCVDAYRLGSEVGVGVGDGAGISRAEQERQNQIRADLLKADTPLLQCFNAIEAHAHGRATDAELATFLVRHHSPCFPPALSTAPFV